ncbi:MAG: Fur family transcriptional regulator [Candidatus Hydrogenedentota bacterium]
MLRSTHQRRAIYRVLEETDRPLSPQEVLEQARREVPNLGIATVYRTVKALTEGGDLTAVQLPGEAPRYELAGKHHHHHFRCLKCNRVFEIEGCPGGLAALLPDGFVLEGHDVVLYGRCNECRKNGQ